MSPHVEQLLQQVGRVLSGALHLFDAWPYSLLGELAHAAPEDLFFLVEFSQDGHDFTSLREAAA